MLLIAYLTAFISGFCVMVVELIAARLIARYLGASLYTWTSVIGVVLAGIAFGNYIGGRIADRYHPKRALSALFILASVSCVFIPVLNNLMGNIVLLLYLPLPVRITMHVIIIFFLPSTILGMISPVVAKFALDQGFKTGRTIGNIYAWGAGGSILGTFVTGFFLISHMGTIAVVWTVAGILGFVGLLYGVKTLLPYMWAATFIILIFLSLSSLGWAVAAGEQLALRQKPDPGILYQRESRYSYIKVECLSESPDIRGLFLDQFLHSVVCLDEPTNLQAPHQYYYIRVFEAVTDYLGKSKGALSTLFIGGGGYVFPRYIEKFWPDSHIEVVEIDPAVTEAAIKVLGLPEKSSLKIEHLDARNYVDELLTNKRRNEALPAFDIIYGDAFNDISVPYQLTTYEFNEKLRRLLSPGGVYMINLVDSLQSGRFLAAMLNTLSKTFPYVYVFSEGKPGFRGNEVETFISVASLESIDFQELLNKGFNVWEFKDFQTKFLGEGAKEIVLTDDYAPVENLLEPAVRQRGLLMASAKFTDLANTLLKDDKLNKAIKYYHRALELNPYFSKAHNNLANALTKQGKFKQAVEHYQRAIQLEPNFAEAYSNLACVLTYEGNLNEAIENYKRSLEIRPGVAETHYNLGIALFKEGRLNEAIEHYSKAVEIKPDFTQAKYNLNLILKRGRGVK